MGNGISAVVKLLDRWNSQYYKPINCLLHLRKFRLNSAAV